MKLLDTSVAVDHLRGHELATELLASAIEAGKDLLASELVRFELFAGVREGEHEGLERLCSALTWIPVTEEIARAGAALARRHRHSHSGIDDVDYLIAATALLLDAELLTTNVRHFPMIEGLTSPY